MTIRVAIVIIFLTTISCKVETERTTEVTDCKPYFTFDKVEYYSILIREDSVFDLEQKESKTIEENRLIELLIGNAPEDISDTSKLLNLEILGFKKREIQKNKFDELDKIFCERKHTQEIYTTCIAVYRDILIFKNINKTIGFARLCFDCGDSIITGTDLNKLAFGQSGDIQKLGILLN